MPKITKNNQVSEEPTLIDGVLHQILKPASSEVRPALFLDRDGCIVVETNYLQRAEDVQLIDGAAKVIASANALNIAVIIVTNQAGIGYGYFTWKEFQKVQDELISKLSDHGAYCDGVFACPHHKKGLPPFQHPNHPSRKPNPGMLLSAAESLNINLSCSWIVGDRYGDLEAGYNAGLAGGIHVSTGHGSNKNERVNSLALATDNFNVLTAFSIFDVPNLTNLFS